ncbi:unnamed protein product [Vicia faba]|uniref:Uncharacterized protein n=1 Tax=Vicia faba TaxID=3906 RepID=A0AAV0Z637_VICFA|nr:unnamed protein product [Vicia faba]
MTLVHARGIQLVTGRLGCSLEGAGKRRIFAISNYMNQRLLKPVHQGFAEAGTPIVPCSNSSDFPLLSLLLIARAQSQRHFPNLNRLSQIYESKESVGTEGQLGLGMLSYATTTHPMTLPSFRKAQSSREDRRINSLR